MTQRSYTNPVHPGSFPDPFVLRFNGRYYAYATGPAADGRLLPMLSSRDLVQWREHGGALDPLAFPGAEEYWAPEVAYAEGTFYLYYAVGRSEDPDHHLRLARAPHPLGPWRDAGVNLTPHELFAIDAHPYRDPSTGCWHLFYACDELSSPRAGTGIVVDRLAAMDRLAGEKRVVIRPYADWQLFEQNRAVKYGLDWYTVEGPYVLYRGGGFVCFYSGGRWENPSYGVAYSRGAAMSGPWVDDANAHAPTVVKTDPGRVVGPGHNSAALGPDLLSDYLVYHAWDPDLTRRTLRIDPLSWREGRPHCEGPSTSPVPVPREPDAAAWFDDPDCDTDWEAAGGWRLTGEGLRADGDGPSRPAAVARDFAAEIDVRCVPGAPCGITVGELPVGVSGGYLCAGSESRALPPGFRPEAWHRLFVRREGDRLTVALDGFPTLAAPAPGGSLPVALVGGRGSVAAHLSLTRLPRS